MVKRLPVSYIIRAQACPDPTQIQLVQSRYGKNQALASAPLPRFTSQLAQIATFVATALIVVVEKAVLVRVIGPGPWPCVLFGSSALVVEVAVPDCAPCEPFGSWIVSKGGKGTITRMPSANYTHEQGDSIASSQTYQRA